MPSDNKNKAQDTNRANYWTNNQQHQQQQQQHLQRESGTGIGVERHDTGYNGIHEGEYKNKNNLHIYFHTNVITP